MGATPRGECDCPKLLKFRGRPAELQPKADFSTFLGSNCPLTVTIGSSIDAAWTCVTSSTSTTRNQRTRARRLPCTWTLGRRWTLSGTYGTACTCRERGPFPASGSGVDDSSLSLVHGGGESVARVDHHRIQKMYGQAVRSTYSFANQRGLLYTYVSSKVSFSSARARYQPRAPRSLGHPVSRAQRTVVLGILLALFVVLTLLRFAPETMKRRCGGGGRKDIC